MNAMFRPRHVQLCGCGLSALVYGCGGSGAAATSQTTPSGAVDTPVISDEATADLSPSQRIAEQAEAQKRRIEKNLADLVAKRNAAVDTAARDCVARELGKLEAHARSAEAAHTALKKLLADEDLEAAARELRQIGYQADGSDSCVLGVTRQCSFDSYSSPSSSPILPTHVYVLAVGSGTALLVGAVSGVVTLNEDAALRDVCHAGECPSSARASVERVEALSSVSTISLVSGAVLGVAAVTTAVVYRLEIRTAEDRSISVRLAATSVLLEGEFQ